MSLSKPQRQVLQALADADPKSLTGVEILVIVSDDELTHQHGVNQVAGQLSRRGHLMKINPTLGRGMAYQITQQGHRALREDGQQRGSVIRSTE